MKRIEDLQTHGLRFMQDTDLFLFGTDAVELANFAAPAAGTTVCDLGAGSGIVSVLLAGKYGAVVTAVEIQEKCCALARENAQLNGLDIAVLHMPMQEFRGRFDIVVCNPPYIKAGGGIVRDAESERIACFEEKVTFDEVAACAERLLSTGGKFYLVHHITRLAEVLATVKAHRLEPKRLQILRPVAHKPPHIFLLECMRDGKEGITVLSERDVLGAVCP
ncbi:MAG: methyltransferase [Clostridia bacterium]|nr:methyltransferase [Clostridia bacterium]